MTSTKRSVTTATIENVEYIAKPEQKTMRCTGCVAEGYGRLCMDLPHCTEDVRDDKRNIIWIKKEDAE